MSNKDREILEDEIMRLQQSTGTRFPIFLRAHNWLRMHLPWYYWWHVKTWSTMAHVVLLFVYLASLTTGVFFTQVNLVHAATVTWDGGGTDGTCGGGAGDGNKWSCAANWSGDVLPTSADAVVFNATSTKDATVDASFAGVITSLSINSGYTGTITLVRSLQTTSTFTQGAGTFTMGSQTLEVDAGFTITAGTFNANTGTVTFAGSTATLACNNVTFNLVTFTGQTGVKTVNSNCSLPLGSSPTMPNGVTLNGTLSGSGTLTETAGTLTLNTGASLSGFSGLAVTTLTVAGATANLSGYSPLTITGTLTESTGSLTLPSNLTVTAVTLSGGTFTAPSGTLTVTGALTVSGSPTFNHNSGTVNFSGSTATLSCNNISFNLVTFTGQTAVKTVNSNCSLPLGASPTLPNGVTLNGTLSGSGTITQTAGTLTLNAGATFSGFSGLNVITLTIAGATSDFSSFTSFVVGNITTLSSGTLTLPNGADLNGALIISAGTFNAPSGSMTAASTLTISGTPTFNANGGTITFDGGTATLSCNNVTFNLVSFTGQVGVKTVNSNCSLPLGASPTIPNGVTLNGILSGTGTLTTTTGTFTLNSGASISGFSGLVTNGAVAVAGGTLSLGSYTTVDMNSSLTLSSGSFTAPSGTMTIATNFTVSGSPTFDANGGTITFDDSLSATLSCNNVVFNRVTINSAATKIVNSNCTLPLGVSPSVVGAVSLSGTLTGSGTLTNTSGTLTLNAGAALSGFSGLTLGAFTNAGATTDLSGYSFLTTTGNLTVSSGTLSIPNGTNAVGVIQSGGTLNAPSGTFTIQNGFNHTAGTFNHNNGTVIYVSGAGQITTPGTDTYYNLTFAQTFDGQIKTVTNSQSLIVLGTLRLTKGIINQVTIPAAGTIQAQGDIIVESTFQDPTFTVGIGSITINGTGNQTFTGNATTTVGAINNLTINKPSGTLFLAGTIRTTKNWTYTAGTIDATTNNSTVVFCGGQIVGSHSLSRVVFKASVNAINTSATVIDPGTTLTALGEVKLTDGSIQTGILNVQGGLSLESGFGGGTTAIIVTGNATQSINLFDGGQLPPLTVNAGSATINGPSSGSVRINGDFAITNGTMNGKAGKIYVAGNLNQSGGTLTAPSGSLIVNGTIAHSGGTFLPNNGTLQLMGSSDKSFAPPPTLHNISLNQGLLGYWKLDQSSSSNIEDSSGMNNLGTVNGPATSSDIPSVGFSDSGSLKFDGVDDYVDVGNDANLRPTFPFSVALWAKFNTGPTDFRAILCSCDTGGNNAYTGFSLWRGTSNDINAWVGNNGGNNSFLYRRSMATSANAIMPDHWHHIAVNFVSLNLFEIYVDGVLKSTGTMTGTATSMVYSGNSKLRFGTINGLSPLNGSLDDIRLYNRALTSTEITALVSGTEYPSGYSATQILTAPLNLTGTLTLNRGTLDVSTNNYAVNVAGNWTNNSGTFVPRAGTVTLNGEDQTITGSNSFYNLTKTTEAATTLTVEAGSTQTITGTLNLQGTSGNLLDLRSSTSGSQWNIDPQGTRTLAYLDVKDSYNRNASIVNVRRTNSVDSGNNTNWLFDAPLPSLALKTIGGGKFTDKTTKFTYYGQHPVFVGTGTPGAVVMVKSGESVWCTTTIDSQGNWTCRTSSALTFGQSYLVTISATHDEQTTTLKTFTLMTVEPTPEMVANEEVPQEVSPTREKPSVRPKTDLTPRSKITDPTNYIPVVGLAFVGLSLGAIYVFLLKRKA